MKTTKYLLIGIFLAVIVITGMGAYSAVGKNWEFVPFYTDATNPVTGWYCIQDGKNAGWMWDKTNRKLAAAPAWTNCVKSIAVDNTSGVFEDRPDPTMPTGEYIWRLWDSASPAYTDPPIKSFYIKWNQQTGQITELEAI